MVNQDLDKTFFDHLDPENSGEPASWDIEAFYKEDGAVALTPAISRMIRLALPPPPDDRATAPEEVRRLTREILFDSGTVSVSEFEEMLAGHFEEGYGRRIRAEGHLLGQFKYWRDVFESRGEENRGAVRTIALISQAIWLAAGLRITRVR